MATSNRFWPFSLVVIGVVFTAWMVLTSPSGASRILQSCDERPAYPGCVEVPVDCGPYPESVCNVTKTAVSQQRTATAAPVLTATALAGAQSLGTATPTVTTTPTATATPTATGTATPTSTGQLAQPTTPARTLAPTVTPISTAVAPTTAPSPSPLPEAETALRCAPADLLELTGETRPQTALLVLFDERPVGGGYSDRAGRFRIVLRIGDERPGQHEIIVQDRERGATVAEYRCETPPPPTPTPTFGPVRTP